MENLKNGSQPAPGAETLTPQKATQLLDYDLKTARVFCHLVQTDTGVQTAVRKALEKSGVKTVPLESIIRDAETSAECIKMLLGNNHMLETLGDIAYSMFSAFQELKKNTKAPE